MKVLIVGGLVMTERHFGLDEEGHMIAMSGNVYDAATGNVYIDDELVTYYLVEDSKAHGVTWMFHSDDVEEV